MSEMVEWERKSKTAEMYTQGEIRIFSEPLLLRSAFGKLVHGHLKTLNHLNFSSLLYFDKSGIEPSFFASQPWAVWHNASAQCGMTSYVSSLFCQSSYVSSLFCQSSVVCF